MGRRNEESARLNRKKIEKENWENQRRNGRMESEMGKKERRNRENGKS